jgi:hypothetical protein
MNNVLDDNIVVLFVGGISFETTVATLCSQDGLLRKLVEHKEEEMKNTLRSDRDPDLRFDRDPDVFRWVMQCLRTGKTVTPPNDLPFDLLRAELQYWEYGWLEHEWAKEDPDLDAFVNILRQGCSVMVSMSVNVLDNVDGIVRVLKDTLPKNIPKHSVFGDLVWESDEFGIPYREATPNDLYDIQASYCIKGQKHTTLEDGLVKLRVKTVMEVLAMDREEVDSVCPGYFSAAQEHCSRGLDACVSLSKILKRAPRCYDMSREAVYLALNTRLRPFGLHVEFVLKEMRHVMAVRTPPTWGDGTGFYVDAPMIGTVGGLAWSICAKVIP